jgi:hypothetical protein
MDGPDPARTKFLCPYCDKTMEYVGFEDQGFARYTCTSPMGGMGALWWAHQHGVSGKFAMRTVNFQPGTEISYG